MDYYCKRYILLITLAVILSGGVRSESFTNKPMSSGYDGRRVLRPRSVDGDDSSYCESWKFTVESGAAGRWSIVPHRCGKYIKKYMAGERYLSDSAFVADESIAFAKNVTLAGDGKDCWVFDVDETLFWNYPFLEKYDYGWKPFNSTAGFEWMKKGVAPALPESLRLYNELRNLNFTIFVLTGRNESYRNVTVKNLLSAGYKNWNKLLLRGASDAGTSALVYKSKKRQELVGEGYRIQGSSGDQWSDLLGNATAVRSFKLPNPMYYTG